MILRQSSCLKRNASFDAIGSLSLRLVLRTFLLGQNCHFDQEKKESRSKWNFFYVYFCSNTSSSAVTKGNCLHVWFMQSVTHLVSQKIDEKSQKSHFFQTIVHEITNQVLKIWFLSNLNLMFLIVWIKIDLYKLFKGLFEFWPKYFISGNFMILFLFRWLFWVFLMTRVRYLKKEELNLVFTGQSSTRIPTRNETPHVIKSHIETAFFSSWKTSVLHPSLVPLGRSHFTIQS